MTTTTPIAAADMMRIPRGVVDEIEAALANVEAALTPGTRREALAALQTARLLFAQHLVFEEQLHTAWLHEAPGEFGCSLQFSWAELHNATSPHALVEARLQYQRRGVHEAVGRILKEKPLTAADINGEAG